MADSISRVASAGMPGTALAHAGIWTRTFSHASLRKLRVLLLLLLAWEVLARLAALSSSQIRLIFPTASAVAVAWVGGMASGEIPSYAYQSLSLLLMGMLI